MRPIDADALLNLPFEKMIHTDYGDTCVPIEEIETAPTVCGNNPKWCESCVSKGKCASTRPQGEWIKVKEERMSVDMSGEIVTRYKCSECERVIATFPSKLADYYPFCHCGAEMKSGQEVSNDN